MSYVTREPLSRPGRCITAEWRQAWFGLSHFCINVLFLFSSPSPGSQSPLVLWPFYGLLLFFVWWFWWYWPAACGMSPSLGFSDVFLMGERALLVLLCRHSWHTWSSWWWPDCLDEVVATRFFHYKVTLFPFPYTVLWKWATKYNPPGCGSSAPLSGRGQYLQILFEILMHGRFVSSPHLFIYSILYLHQYGLRDIYFVLWIVIQYYVVLLCWLNCSSFGTGSSVRLVPVSLWCAPSFSFFPALSYFWVLRGAPGSPCIFPALACNQPVLQGAPTPLGSFKNPGSWTHTRCMESTPGQV